MSRRSLTQTSRIKAARTGKNRTCMPPPPLSPLPLPLPHPGGVKALNGLGTFSISTEAPRPAQINRRTPPKKVTFSATLECNYHVLNSLTPPPPHLHPPLFFLFSEGFFSLFFRAKITLESPKAGERQSFLFHFFFYPDAAPMLKESSADSNVRKMQRCNLSVVRCV